MAAFDVASGTAGASAGAGLGPYGAAAGFVIGGFLGGAANRNAKKQRQTIENKIRRRLSPQYYNNLVREFTPIAREGVVNSGAGNVIKQDVGTNLARQGLNGTGVGAAIQSAASLAPSNIAFQTANQLASNTQAADLNSVVGLGQFDPRMADQYARRDAGDIATAIAIFRSLKGSSSGRSQTNPDGSPTFNSTFPSGGGFPSGYPSSTTPWRIPGWDPNNPMNPGSFAQTFPNATGGWSYR
jgi:hypothetical protein